MVELKRTEIDSDTGSAYAHGSVGVTTVWANPVSTNGRLVHSNFGEI